ncbi:FIST signal transduction protein [Candidatus Aenigmatarchaeota archaeon]
MAKKPSNIKLKKKNSKNVHAGVGISKSEDPYKAGVDAVKMAIKKAGKPPEFGVVFCSGAKYGKDEATIKKLVKGANDEFKKHNKSCRWIGCTTAGEISNYGYTENSCVALSLTSDFVNVGIGVSEGVAKAAYNSGKTAVNKALTDLKIDKYLFPYVRFLETKRKTAEEIMNLNPYTVITLCPGSTMTYAGLESDVINGIADVIGAHIPLIGGSAGDGFNFKQTYQFANGKLYKDAVITAVFVLGVVSETGVGHGYKPTDNIVLVTESEGKMVKTLNNKPAIEVYSKLTGKTLKELEGPKPAWVGTEFPFGVVDMEGKYWIKSPQAQVDSSLMFFSNIPKNSLLALMKPTKENTLNVCKNSLPILKDTIASILFDCGGRKTFLGKSCSKENSLIKKTLKDTPFIGFYSYAEIGYSFRTPPTICNETLVSFSISNKLLSE